MCHGDYFIEEESFAMEIGKVMKESVKDITKFALWELEQPYFVTYQNHQTKLFSSSILLDKNNRY